MQEKSMELCMCHKGVMYICSLEHLVKTVFFADIATQYKYVQNPLEMRLAIYYL